MNRKAAFILLFAINISFAQETLDKVAFRKCRKEFSKKICLSDDDKDGQLFYLDQCPTDAGLLENNGCPYPDTDGDEVIDNDDACPTVAGSSENNGCPWPDTDGDGILDKDDACPTIPGIREKNGCSEKKCSKNYEIARKEADDYINFQKEINYKSLQKPVLEILKKIKFDSAVLLIINPNIFEGHGPSECPAFEFPETLNYTTESYIWNAEMLRNILIAIKQNIFPASNNSLFWGDNGFYKENDEEFGKLNREQITFINKLATFYDPKYGKIKYLKIKNKKLSKLPDNFNRIILEENGNIENKKFHPEITFVISTNTTIYNYTFKYIFETTSWSMIAEGSYKNENTTNNILKKAIK
ncbi:MAG: hypothetical protein K0R77_1040 [Chryseobacterium sp.]|jgi:hypothetical protein|nr:hypothetical protein [Chryseobacterium sp.]